jgi:hypothetical protein
VTAKIPANMPLEVLSPDNPQEQTLGFTIKEYLGGVVFKARSGVTEVKNFGDIDTERLLKSRDDLKEGDDIFVTSLWGGLMKVTVKKDTYGELFAEDGDLMVVLSFGEDDRQCWTTMGYINKRGIERLQLDSKP